MLKNFILLMFISLFSCYHGHAGQCPSKEPASEETSSKRRATPDPAVEEKDVALELPKRVSIMQAPGWEDVQNIVGKRDKDRPCVVIFDINGTLIDTDMRLIQSDTLKIFLDVLHRQKVVTCCVSSCGETQVLDVLKILAKVPSLGQHFPRGFIIDRTHDDDESAYFDKFVFGVGNSLTKIDGVGMILEFLNLPNPEVFVIDDEKITLMLQGKRHNNLGFCSIIPINFKPLAKTLSDRGEGGAFNFAKE